MDKRQYQFVANYAQNGGNAQQAALDAGYALSTSKNASYTLLNNNEIKQKIETIQLSVAQQAEQKLKITFIDRANLLLRIINDILPTEEQGEQKRDYYKDAIRAVAELNKMLGGYAIERKVTLNIDATKTALKDARKAYEDY